MGQLHEFGIVQTNVQVQEKRQKKDEDGNCGAHSYCTSCLPWQFGFCVTAWPNLSAHIQQQLSPHILTRPSTAKHTTDWIYRLSMQTRAVPRREAGAVVLVHWEVGQELEPPSFQHLQQRQSRELGTPEMHNTGCIVPSDLLAIL